MSTTTINVAPRVSRVDDLKAMLESRRAEVVRELQDKIRAVRSDGIAHRDLLEDAERAELDLQDDIGFALIQLKTEMLNQIDSALRRLQEGNYGDCFECGTEIAEARLRALPFAVRCRDCEQGREAAHGRERLTEQRRGSPALFVDLGG
ncbi:MAG TPA: TraR/DksA C4-type zinc finger protein [Vicinamibacterales bacterium]|nr:TraR/DksA C4-type zinc finger protein [Vicinamibacterales bacterium]